MSDKKIQTVLCYGDGLRFDEQTRWPRVLGACLGSGFRVDEEGLNGRSLKSFAPPGDPANGKEYLVSVHQTGAVFVDTSRIIEASYIDGVHLDARNHVLLGNYLCDFLHNERFSGG